ncbi:MAG: ABC transporter ATP-binding protein [Verrucomicrobiae bacterium]|nr:ABC transporter ATP-binding protein [Verrucomicrobiae bacterium]
MPGEPSPVPNLLEIRGLSIGFRLERSRTVRVVEDVCLSLRRGETLGLVGESGCGKSLTALSIARLLPSPPAEIASGEILIEGRNVLAMSRSELRTVRGGVVSYVFQDAGASLNPVQRIGTQIRECLRIHRPEAAGEEEVLRLLRRVGIPAAGERMRSFPHELSGGMQQRVMLALAIAPRPKLLIADEPTTALDVTLQAQIIDLLRELQGELGMSILLITHNLGIVGDLADHIAVMYAGQIVETGPTRAVLQSPAHPYTQALMDSVPASGAPVERLRTIPGIVPPPGAWPTGCRFHPRCPVRQDDCASHDPMLSPRVPTDSQSRLVRCPHAPGVLAPTSTRTMPS